MKLTIMESTQRINSVFRLADAVPYNSGRIIFDQLMRASYGGVNILAMKAGQNLVKHTAPGAVTIYVLEGKVRFIIDGKSQNLKAGDAVVMEAGTPHGVHAVADSKIMLVKIDN